MNAKTNMEPNVANRCVACGNPNPLLDQAERELDAIKAAIDAIKAERQKVGASVAAALDITSKHVRNTIHERDMALLDRDAWKERAIKSERERNQSQATLAQLRAELGRLAGGEVK